jgi:DNA ligase-1
MSLPKLFKFAKSGATQEWSIEAVANFDGTAAYETTYGQVGGSLQTTRVDIIAGKNIGKSNETTPLEQATSEATSKWKGQLDKGYAVGKPKPLMGTSPMLAKSYDKFAHKVTFPCYWQPKLDGVRCIAHRQGDKITMLSRKGKVFDTLGHITAVLIDLMDDGEILDGELYIHGETFQRTISWVKRLQPDTAKVVYNIYDIINDKPYAPRFDRICALVGHKGKGIIRTTFTSKLNSHKEIAKVLKEQEDKDYEGIMLRVGICAYQVGRRSVDLLKVKTFLDEEFEITGAEETKGRQKGQCVFVCKTSLGAEFRVKPMGTDAERCKMWDDHAKLIGQMLTVRFFEWTTSVPPVPRFPVGVGIRDYE